MEINALNEFNCDRLDNFLNERDSNISKELNISEELVGDRLRTLSLLEQFGLPVPPNQAVDGQKNLQAPFKQ